ncbi:cation efflux family-domain-containing protein [Pilobolus umbonatus]|nr:cation efflux family-domain-containing protein [Pilobolus umbonatus]
MQQTRQFTKRRPQSPQINQQESLEGLKVGMNKPIRSGLAIQSTVPIHIKQLGEHQKIEGEHDIGGFGHHSSEHQHSSGCNHSKHDHSGHNHSTPYEHSGLHQSVHDHSGHHDHSAHPHDHAGHPHDHSGHHHDHSGHHHDHSGHHHDHSGHHHDHSGHHHDHSGHAPLFPQIYTQPLPSYPDIFNTLSPNQKTLFSCFLAQCLIGVIVWLLGASRGSLAITGYAYLLLFDGFGTLGNFVSTVLHLNTAFSAVTMKRPFGTRRFEIIFALANTIFLLFGTMYTIKESLEHLLLEHHHVGDHHENESNLLLYVMLLVAMASTMVFGVTLKNHDSLVKLRRGVPQSVAFHSFDTSHLNTQQVMKTFKDNYFCSSIISCGGILFLTHLMGLHTPVIDKLFAFIESGVMLYLGGPTAIALAKVLLQTKPDFIQSGVERTLRQIQQDPQVVSVDNVHLWQISFSKCVGTADINIKSTSDEDHVLDTTYNLLDNSLQSNGELTIGIKTL